MALNAFQLKYLSLFCLILQTTSLVLTMRFSRIQHVGNNQRYISSTAVFLAEVLKVIICYVVVIYNNGWSVRKASKIIKTEVWNNYRDTIKVFVPAALYTVQNNLLYVALSNLDAATYQVTYQLKILTTALFSVLMLRRKLSFTQWLSLLLLMTGVSLVQIPNQTSGATQSSKSNAILGILAIIIACISSGFSGVYFEKILKESQVTIWIRNIQLGLLGTFVALAGVFVNDGAAVWRDGLLQGYNWVTWAVIGQQAAGGLVIAVVIKYADNILKGFATSISIVLSSVISYFFIGDLVLTSYFLLGTMGVMSATFLYGYTPPKRVEGLLV